MAEREPGCPGRARVSRGDAGRDRARSSVCRARSSGARPCRSCTGILRVRAHARRRAAPHALPRDRAIVARQSLAPSRPCRVAGRNAGRSGARSAPMATGRLSSPSRRIFATAPLLPAMWEDLFLPPRAGSGCAKRPRFGLRLSTRSSPATASSSRRSSRPRAVRESCCGRYNAGGSPTSGSYRAPFPLVSAARTRADERETVPADIEDRQTVRFTAGGHEIVTLLLQARPCHRRAGKTKLPHARFSIAAMLSVPSSISLLCLRRHTQ